MRLRMFTKFEGVWVPIITPFLEGKVDLDALATLAKYLAFQGVSGLVAGATTGEGALLGEEEVETVFMALRQAVPTLPIVLGFSETGTKRAEQRAAVLAHLKPEGLLVTPPTYLRPSQAGIQSHFEAIAQAADLPILIYNIPYRTGVNIDLETLQALCTDARIVGIKECGGSAERMVRIIHETRLRVFSGDDSQNFVALCLGAHGAIAATAHIFPELQVRCRARLLVGDLTGARAIAVAFQPLIRHLFAEPSPAPLKALLSHQGFCRPEVRAPFHGINADRDLRLQEDWRALKRFKDSSA